MKSTQTYVEQEIIQHALDGLTEILNGMDDSDVYDTDDLHNSLFNQDYFIIGHYNASRFMEKNQLDAFDLIFFVQDWEEENFGSTSTSVDGESMVNMYAYIRGEQLLNELNSLEFGEKYTKSQMTDVFLEVNEMLK